MTAIWHKGEQGWAILEPVGFPDEAALHTLVADAPQVLPLAGSPRLVVLGSEVRIGSGSADILAVEPSGRLAIIEVKLAKNAEARRAVVDQILTYAAYLRGTSRESLEHELLASHLAKRQYAGVFEAVEQNIQDGSVQAESFLKSIDESLAAGAFRLVLVLDQAPAELVQLVGYLESVAPELTTDLITVSKYSVEGAAILVPQRVDPERAETELAVKTASAASKGYYADGGADFRQTAESLAERWRGPTAATSRSDWRSRGLGHRRNRRGSRRRAACQAIERGPPSGQRLHRDPGTRPQAADRSWSCHGVELPGGDSEPRPPHPGLRVGDRIPAA